jgi:hypothetical protein
MLSIILLVLIGVITFFHYTQGFWSATLSAILTIIAAVLAVSYHEVVVTSLLQGQVADQAHAIALVGLFAGIYLILRVLFDITVPGNIRFPVIVDKVGAGVMGLVAALFGVGVIAIAAQTMPFGPGVATRYALAEDREVALNIPGKFQAQDIKVMGELEGDTLEPENARGLTIAVDELVVNTVEKLSDGGSLAGKRSFAAVHPDYLDELFAQRLGVQVGANRTALNIGGKEQAKVVDVFRVEQVTPVDAESSPTRARPVKVPNRPGAGKVFLVVRTLFSRDAGDADGLFRFSPGSIRLVAPGEEGPTNYHPIGTLHNTTHLVGNRVDDFLFVNVKDADRGADLVFEVDRRVLAGEGSEDQKLVDGVVLEVKRLARVDLSGQAVSNTPQVDPRVQVMRKSDAVKVIGGAAPAGGARPGGPPGQPGAAAAGPVSVSRYEVNPRLFTPINVATPQLDINNQQLPSGTVSLTDRKIAKMDMNPTQTIALLSRGDHPVDELYAPDGQKVVQVIAKAPEGNDAWTWAEGLKEFALKDAAGKSYLPAGAWAKVKQQNQEKLVGAYDARATTPPSVGKEDGQPAEVWIAFVVPNGTQLKQLTYKNQPIRSQDLTVQ